MTIGVHRLYVSSAWMQPDALRLLTRVLDRLPGFLYRIDRLPDAETADDDTSSPEASEMLRARVRIALTQAHIAILHPSELVTPCDETLAIIELARTGFRRRIPILGITESRSPRGGDACSPSMDQLVSLDSSEIASAMQDLAEQSAQERRKLTESLLERPLALVGAQNSLAMQQFVNATDHQRSLPVQEIMAALAELKQAQELGKAQR